MRALSWIGRLDLVWFGDGVMECPSVGFGGRGLLF